MSPTLADFHELYEVLQQAPDPERRVACQAFCRAVVGAERRGEIPIRTAAALIEGALQLPGLEADEATAALQERAVALQSPPALPHDPLLTWRDLVRHLEVWPPPPPAGRNVPRKERDDVDHDEHHGQGPDHDPQSDP